MSNKPTLIQTLFNQPSQRYAIKPSNPPSKPHIALHDVQPFPSSAGTLLAPGLDVASEKLASPPDISTASAPHAECPSPPSPADSDIFFTPLSTPRASAFVSSSSDQLQAMSSSSIASSTGDDDLFSWRSATTSATSLSDSAPPAKHHTVGTKQRRPASYDSHTTRSRPRKCGAAVAEWSKDVRWLVPPDVSHASSTSSLIRGLDLVDVEYDRAPSPKGKPRMKPGRKTRPPESEHMSALLEVEEDEDQQSAQTAPVVGNTPAARARTISAPVRRLRPSSVISRASSTRTVALPTPLPVSSGTASTSTGYTSLTLPRAAYAPSKHPARVSSTVDITRSGLAQTTMSTISIARHAAASASRFVPRLKSNPPDTPAHLRATLPSPLSFASHTPPPGKVHSGQVLVQVWAVALDTLDANLVEERAARSDGFGFVPGRSFVGRAVECGWEVNSVARGDWVFGLTEVRKCGALSEFIVVDRRRVHRSPRPSAHLTINQIALLPLAGVPAHRAVRTFAHLPRGSRALVLHAHAGAGLLAAQELATLGFRVTAQVPSAWGAPEEKRARAAGARDVRCGAAAEVVDDVKGEEFDGVVDALGGKAVWDACRRVLRTQGQFTTLVGDADSGLPSANAHFKSNMRSLRRAFVKKDRKSVGYQWVSPAADVDGEGEDVRDSLAAVARMAEDGVFVPYVGSVLPFERTSDAFSVDPATRHSMVSLGGTAVVRIVD